MEIAHNIIKRFYVGPAKSGSWSSVYTYKPKNEHFLEEKGEVFAVISVEGPKGFKASTAGNLLLDHLHESYFEGEKTSPLYCLEEALLSTAKRLGQIVDNDEIAEKGIDLSITAVSIVGDNAYLASLGGGTIHIFRDGNLVNASAALRDSLGSGHLQSASTVVHQQDVILLMSQGGGDNFTHDELIVATQNFSEKSLKNKPLEFSNKLSILMLGIELNEDDFHEEEVKDKKLKSVFASAGNDVSESFANREDADKDDKLEVSDVSKNEDLEGEVGDDKMLEVDEDHAESDNDDLDEEEVEYEEKLTVFEKIKFRILDIKDTVIEKGKQSRLPQRIKAKWSNIKPADSNDTTLVYILKNARFYIADYSKKFKVRFWDEFLQMENGLYLKDARRGINWRFVIVAVVAVILLLFIVIRVVSFNNANAEREATVEKAIASAESTLVEVRPQVETALSDPDEYRLNREEISNDINSNISRLRDALEFEINREEISTLIDELSELKVRIERRVILPEADLLVDFIAEVDENANPVDITVSDNKIYIVDQNTGKIYSMNFDGSGFEEVATGLVEPRSIDVTDDGILTGIDEESDPFFGISGGEVDRFTGIVVTAPETIREIQNFDIFDSNRIYYVKNSGNPVEYIYEVGAGYAGATSRVEDQSVAGATDIDISDGKIYLLQPGSPLVRFNDTEKETVSILGATSQEEAYIQSSRSFDVSGEYIVYGASEGRSIVVTTKGGQNAQVNNTDLLAQISFSEELDYLSNIKEVKIDNSSDYIFVLDGSRLLRIDLNDLQDYL